MWILNQNKKRISMCDTIYIDDKSFYIRDGFGNILGEYNSIEECQNVFNEIVTSIKYKHDIFSMPKKEDLKQEK